MKEQNKKILKKLLSGATILLTLIWVSLFFYGMLVERQVALKLEKNNGQIFAIDITRPMEKLLSKKTEVKIESSRLEAKPELDKLLHEVKETTPLLNKVETGSNNVLADNKQTQPQADLAASGESKPQPETHIKEQIEIPTMSIPANNDKAKVAIIVTNIGTNEALTEQALKLPNNVTLGFSAYTVGLKNLYQQAVTSGFDIFIYLPFEPKDYPLSDPGPYAILSENLTDKNITLVKNILSSFPEAKGVYGNYREALSLNQKAFVPILEFMDQKHLKVFLGRNFENDSPNYLSLYKNVIAGDVIIDLVPDPDAIKHSLANLVALAKGKKSAVGYLNSYPVSLTILSQWLATFNDNSVEIVPLSAIAGK